MSNKLSKYVKKLVLGKDQNLVSIDEPYGVMQRLLAGRMVTGLLDAGASDGHISERMLRYFPQARAYAFEPNPVYRGQLQQLNVCQPRIVPVFAALSDREGTVDLHVTASPGNTSICMPAKRFATIDPEGSMVSRVEKVEMVTVDEWSARNDNIPIHVMKFDIQGHELAALKGAARSLHKHTLAVYVEIWFNAGYAGGAVFAEIDLFLRGHGFVLWDIYKPGYHKNGMLMWANALFVKEELADNQGREGAH
jgi:FkbM family methyltransferase